MPFLSPNQQCQSTGGKFTAKLIDGEINLTSFPLKNSLAVEWNIESRLCATIRDMRVAWLQNYPNFLVCPYASATLRYVLFRRFCTVWHVLDECWLQRLTSTERTSCFTAPATRSTTRSSVKWATSSAPTSTCPHADRSDCNSLPVPVTWLRGAATAAACVTSRASGATRSSSATNSSTPRSRLVVVSSSSTSKTLTVQSRSVRHVVANSLSNLRVGSVSGPDLDIWMEDPS